MASIKELRLRIKSLKNTNKITAAMKLVATSKLKKSQDAMKANKPFSDKLNEMLQRVVGNLNTSEVNHPLLAERPVKKTRYYLFSSDKGLCGGFNNGLIKYFTKTVDMSSDFEVHTVGKKVNDHFSRLPEFSIAKDFGALTKTLDESELKVLVDEAIQDYIDGKIDQVVVVFNEFESVLAQNPTMKTLLPVSAPSTEEGPSSDTEYIYEPSAQELLSDLLPRYVYVLFYQTLLENAAGEHGARMTAMDNATNNSRDLIDSLTIVMNRARQAAITTELTEIVSGAESLKG